MFIFSECTAVCTYVCNFYPKYAEQKDESHKELKKETSLQVVHVKKKAEGIKWKSCMPNNVYDTLTVPV